MVLTQADCLHVALYFLLKSETANRTDACDAESAGARDELRLREKCSKIVSCTSHTHRWSTTHEKNESVTLFMAASCLFETQGEIALARTAALHLCSEGRARIFP